MRSALASSDPCAYVFPGGREASQLVQLHHIHTGLDRTAKSIDAKASRPRRGPLLGGQAPPQYGIDKLLEGPSLLVC